MRILLFGITFFTASLLIAQSSDKYDWEQNRKFTNLSDTSRTGAEYVLKAYRGYEYFWENNELYSYQTDHRITRVVTTNAIERHNRIYISMRNVVDIIVLKARAINSTGRVTNFDKNNLKEIQDEESDNTYRIFAIEGVEANSEIEFFYTLKVKSKLHDTYYFQQEVPVLESGFQLTCPKNLKFDFRIYNDGSKIVSDTLVGKNRYRFNASSIPGLKKESFTYFDAYRKRVELKLAYNFGSSSARLSTWADAAKIFYRGLTKTDKSTEKELSKYIKTLKDNSSQLQITRIKNIEDHVKDNFRVVSNSSAATLGEVSSILKSQQASAEGITKLLLMIYERVGIPVYLVITCNREYAKFDGSFDTWGYLDEYLLYFPGTDQFLAPDSYELRFPIIPRNRSANQGLFIEPVSIGELKTGIAWIKEIPALPYTADSDNLFIDVKFSEDLESNQIQHDRKFIGYDAASMLPYYKTLSDEQRNEFVKSLFTSSVPDLELKKWSVEMPVQDLFPGFKIKTEYITNHFLERAGSRILLKAGELIGPQSELYREENRQTPVENTHNRGYEREILIHIPKGYTVSNVESLNFKVEYKDDNDVPFSFVSSYTMEDDLISIKIEEYYKEIYAPLERYEDFRKVVNAAADFNKVTLVFLKK